MKQLFIDNKRQIIHDLENVVVKLLVSTYISDCYLCNMTSGNTKEYLQAQKPNGRCNKDFTKHPKYVGQYVWWEYYLKEVDGPLTTTLNEANAIYFEEVILEKIRFVKHIIDKLEKA